MKNIVGAKKLIKLSKALPAVTQHLKEHAPHVVAGAVDGAAESDRAVIASLQQRVQGEDPPNPPLIPLCCLAASLCIAICQDQRIQHSSLLALFLCL